MKQVFLMLVFWAGMVHGVFAGYDINLTMHNSITGEITFTVITNANTTWTHSDMISWVFPDGQFVQKKVTVSGSTVSDNFIVWAPKSTIPVSSQIYAFIAKKGGAGIPPAIVEQTNYTLLNQMPPASVMPPPFGFPLNKPWQVNNSWNFTPGQFSFILISYKQDPTCSFGPGHSFTVELPQGITKVGQFYFNGESISSTNPYTIATTATNSDYKHILLKLQVDNTIFKIGDNFTVKVKSSSCPSTDSIYSYDIKRDPHDPNEKTVSIKRICDSKYAKTLRYRVQFHNDGKAPVNKVEVWDPLASQLDPFSYRITKSPTMNGMAMPFTPPPPSMNPNKKIKFSGPGLPGLGQTDVIYVYSQTIYAFEFEVDTRPGFTGDIHNYAVVTFFDSAGNPLDPIPTNIETVYYGCEKPSFCKCFRSLFRPNKERPKP